MDNDKQKNDKTKDISLDGTLPHQISAPDFKNSSRTIQKPFVNEFGVVIGDSLYESKESPLHNWSTETDPSVMAGDRWIHPTNDIGWNSIENRELLEDQEEPDRARFMHPTLDVSKGKD
ncbi:hypothetical protein BP422_29760 [Brevibacillus formosus]|uniref:DUF3905 domain-containing protein n=1 Tax=Brevibacillus formosus TaxID=54913 RepID=A0A220MQJ8_9BACL|nr:DUF3905 domain-containing protein [Brevibacillus formosus]ASJ57331.1 hypothetical protein BP422_29760 [Brevibacillus formosus]